MNRWPHTTSGEAMDDRKPCEYGPTLVDALVSPALAAPTAPGGQTERSSNAGVVKAPRRFRTAYILFASQRHQELRSKLGEEERAMKVSVIASPVSLSHR